MGQMMAPQPRVIPDTSRSEVAPASPYDGYDPLEVAVPPVEESNTLSSTGGSFGSIEALFAHQEREQPKANRRFNLASPTERVQPEARPQHAPSTEPLVPRYTRPDWLEEDVEDIYIPPKPHVPTLEERLRTAKTLLQQTVQERDQLVTDNQELQDQIASLGKQVRSVGVKDAQITNLKQQIAGLRWDKDSLEMARAQLRQQIADLTTERTHLTALLKQLSHTVMERQRREAEASEQSRLRLIRARMRSRTQVMGVSVTRAFARQEVSMGSKDAVDQARKATTGVASLPEVRAIEAARKAGQMVEHAQLEEASRLLAKDLASAGSPELRTHLTQLYLECKSPEEQAHVVGSLLTPEYRELLSELLADPSERNLLRTRLSETEREHLLAIAEIGDEVRRTEVIFQLASGGPPGPPTDPPPGVAVSAPEPDGDRRPGVSSDSLITALRRNDWPGVQRLVGDNTDAAVERIVAAVRFDELSHGELRKLRTKSQEVRELAERALHLLADERGPQSGAGSPGGGQQVQARPTMPRDRASIRTLLKQSGPMISAMGATYAGDPSTAPILIGQWVAEKA